MTPEKLTTNRQPCYAKRSGAGKAPKLSVAMCTYNGDRYVEEQLRSILGQSRAVDEIIVSDDGSSDATLDKVRETVGNLPSGRPVLKTLTGSRLGITQNFARAVSACTGDIIFLSDQDDVWVPSKVERILKEFERHPNSLLVFSDARLVDASLNEIGKSQFQTVRMTNRQRRALTGQRGFEILLRRNVVTGATVAFRRELLQIALPFPRNWLHDEWLAILAAAKNGLGIIDEPLVMYRQHDSNQCGMRPESITSQVASAASSYRDTKRYARIRQVADRLVETNTNPDGQRLHHLQLALNFEEKRQCLPASRFKRILYVGRLAITGRYWRYTDGARSILKDILARQ